MLVSFGLAKVLLCGQPNHAAFEKLQTFPNMLFRLRYFTSSIILEKRLSEFLLSHDLSSDNNNDFIAV